MPFALRALPRGVPALNLLAGPAAKQSEIDDLERKLADARAELGELRRVRAEQEAGLARASGTEQELEQASEALRRQGSQVVQLEAQVQGLKALLAETESRRDELLAMVEVDLQVRRRGRAQRGPERAGARPRRSHKTASLVVAEGNFPRRRFFVFCGA